MCGMHSGCAEIELVQELAVVLQHEPDGLAGSNGEALGLIEIVAHGNLYGAVGRRSIGRLANARSVPTGMRPGTTSRARAGKARKSVGSGTWGSVRVDPRVTSILKQKNNNTQYYLHNDTDNQYT